MYIDGVRYYVSTNFSIKTISYLMTAGTHDIVIITYDTNYGCGGTMIEIDGIQFNTNLRQLKAMDLK